MQVGRLSYKCRCGAWRWCDRAEALGEAGCTSCGTSFEHAAIEFWGTGAPARSREQSHQVQGRKGSGAKATASKGATKGKSQGGKSGSGKGPQTGPKPIGRQDHLQAGSGKGATAATPKPGHVVSYNKSKFKSDPVYAAQSWLEMAQTIYGEGSKEVTDAAQKVAEAIKSADEKRTPAQRATRLREDRITYIDAIAKQLQRTQHLQLQQEEISAELAALDEENQQALARLKELDEQIAMFELAAGLPGPLQAGGQVSQEPVDQVQTKIQALFTPVQKIVEASGAKDAQDKLKEFEILMGEFQSRTMAIVRPDTEMEQHDELNTSDSDLDEGEPKPKTARRSEPNTVTSKADIATDAEDDEETWTQVLGPQARRAQKANRLAQQSIQDITKRLQTTSPTWQQSQRVDATKGKGKGKGKNPGKGPLCVLRTATASDQSTERQSKWSEGPPLLPGTGFPPAGALWNPPQATASDGAASSSAAPNPETGQAKPTGITVELSEGEWKEVLANRGGDGHLS